MTTIELTRTNLLALLAKLDGHPVRSECSIYKQHTLVKAVEDAEHYTDRPRGVMHPETEAVLRSNPLRRSAPWQQQQSGPRL